MTGLFEEVAGDGDFAVARRGLVTLARCVSEFRTIGRWAACSCSLKASLSYSFLSHPSRGTLSSQLFSDVHHNFTPLEQPAAADLVPATMSSYVAKSKKTFQPKAPVRRGAASASKTPSVRNSQEPRVSATPQPAAIDAAPNNSGAGSKPVHPVNEAAHTDNAQHGTNVAATANARASPARASATVDIESLPSRRASTTTTSRSLAKAPASEIGRAHV